MGTGLDVRRGVLLMATPRRFGRFRQAVAELARVPAALAKPVAAAIQRDMRAKLRAGQDPYGTAYAPLTAGSLRRGRKPPPLRRYAPLARAMPSQGAGVSIVIDHPQAGFHQTGTSQMAKRIVIPDRGIPAAWRAAIERAYKAELRRRLSA